MPPLVGGHLNMRGNAGHTHSIPKNISEGNCLLPNFRPSENLAKGGILCGLLHERSGSNDPFKY